MKRDFDLIREILLDFESQPAGDRLEFTNQGNHDLATVNEHLSLMIEAGLLNKRKNIPMRKYPLLNGIADITWAGHDFIASVREDNQWAKVKQYIAKNKLDLTFDVVKAIIKAGVTSLG